MRKWRVKAAILALLLPLLSFSQSQSAYAAEGDTDTALTFNGSTNLLSVTDASFGYRSVFTIQGWIRPTDVACVNGCTVFSHDADYVMKIISGTFRLWQYYNYNQITTELDTGISAKINEWQHVAYTYSSGTQKFYLNGQLVWQNVISGWSSNPTYWSNFPFKLGYHYGSSYFSGQMDEIRLYSTTRTESEITGDLYTWGPSNASGLVAYYDMNDVSGSSVVNKASGATSATTMTMTGTLAVAAIESSTTVAGTTTVTFPRSYLTANGGYKLPAGASQIQLLVVGGGGGGGFDGGGGGGGGGVYQNSNLNVTENSFYEVDVGVGGKGTTGYAGGSSYCNGVWSTVIVGCSGGTGGSSKFGTITASGGGGGGGIEANGSADSDPSATVRGGGGGAGGQNSKSGVGSPGVGGFTGGSTGGDVSGNSGGGGASGSAAGFNGSTASAGNGATGATSTINSLVYGSGGAGGNFNTSTLATGGSGAGDGGTTAVAPTNPVANRGGGGAGGGNGGVTNGAKGTAGAFGVVIIKWTPRTGISFSYSGTPTFRSLTTLTATVNTASKVTFFANDKKIPRCISLSTAANVATCNWKPSTRGPITVSVQVTPLDTNFNSLRQTLSSFFALSRSGRR